MILFSRSVGSAVSPLVLICALGMGVASSAKADIQDLKIIGGTIKNRKTDKHIALACDKSEGDTVCRAFQFVIAHYNRDSKTYTIEDTIGPSIGYIALDALAKSTAEAIPAELVKTVSFKINKFTDDVTNMVFTEGAPITDLTQAGRMWRELADLALSTVAIAADGVRYAAKAVVNGPVSFITRLLSGRTKNRVLRGMTQFGYEDSAGSTITISDNAFEFVYNTVKLSMADLADKASLEPASQ